MSHMGGGAPRRKRRHPHERGLSIPKEPALLRDLEANQTAVHGPAVTGWTVCRFHGARGGGPKGEKNGMYRHGLNTKEAVKERRFLSDLLRQSRTMLCEEIQ